MNLKEIYLSLALFSIAFVILLLTLYPYRPSSSDSPKLPPVSTPTPTPSITWQTYQNSQYGFEFQYPENLVLKIQKINGDQDEIQLFNSKNNQLINIEYLPNFSCPKDSCKLLTPINFGKNTFTPIETETGHQIYLFNKVYRIWVNTDDDQDKISPQILSTFKLLPDTTTWKTYKNTKYGFSLNLPSDYQVYLPTIIEFPSNFTVNNSPTVGIRKTGSSDESKQIIIDIFNNSKTAQSILTESLNKIKTNNNLFVSLIQDIHEITFQGKKAYEFSIKSRGINNSHIGFLGPLGDIKMIAIQQDEQNVLVISYYNENPFDQILSTFKLLPDTSTWKTYKNQQYGFEFKYPSNLVHKSEKTISDIGELIGDSFTTADYKSSEISSNPAYPQESIKSGLKLTLSLLKDGCQSNSPEIIKNGDMLSNVKKLSSQIPSAQYHYEWEGQSSDGVVFKINGYCPVINFNYGSNYVSTWETLRDQIISTFKLLPNTSISPTISTSIYTCPAGEWVDCMPSTDPVKKECQPAYLNWAKINCPGFKGAAL